MERSVPATEVVIPTFNGIERLHRTLESLSLAGNSAAICVVDNGSDDGTLEAVRADHPDVRIVALGQNLGFGTAVNRGIESSEADVVILLNNDAVAEPGFVAGLQRAHLDGGAEMVAGCLLDRNGAIDTLGTQIDESLIAYDYLHAREWSAEIDRLVPEPVLGPSGGAALFDRGAFLSLGGFDEQIFAYLEDVELAIRMRSSGMRLAIAADARAVHEHSGTLGSGSDRKNYLLGWSRGYLLRKHGRRLGARARLRGAAIETVAYAGKAAIDRNLGAVRGRFDAARLREVSRSDTDLTRLPTLKLTTVEALRRRRGRRRP